MSAFDFLQDAADDAAADAEDGSGGGITSSGVTAGFGAAGLGLSLYGTLGAMSATEQEAGYQAQAAAYSGNIAGLEQKVNEQRRQQMMLNANRSNIENLRTVQKAQAMGLTKATAAGAQYGSSIQGEEGAAAAEGAFNTKGIRQNVQIGQNIFDLQGQESLYKILTSQAQSSAASAAGVAAKDQGIAAIGKGIASAAPMLGMLLV